MCGFITRLKDFFPRRHGNEKKLCWKSSEESYPIIANVWYNVGETMIKERNLRKTSEK